MSTTDTTPTSSTGQPRARRPGRRSTAALVATAALLGGALASCAAVVPPVSDRFSASTLAYQGYGRGLDIGELSRLVEWATTGLTPDLTVLVDVDPEVGTARRRGSVHDRLEREGDGFLRRVADGYRALVAEGDPPWLVVDGRGTIEEVAAQVWEGVQARLGVPA